MHIEVLSEDKSGSLVLNALLAGILKKNAGGHTWSVRPHRGKGYLPKDLSARPKPMASGLLDLLAARLRAYASVCDPDNWVIVIVMDSDDQKPDDVVMALKQITLRYAGDLPIVMGICVEEMEAWLLGDRQAIRKAYPAADLNQARHYVQDSVCGTWEILAHVIMGQDARRLIKVGYPAVGQYKSEWAEHIASYMDPQKNDSPSFRRFYSELLKTMEMQEAKDEKF